MRPFILHTSSFILFSLSAFADLTDADLARTGHKIWVNECAGTVAGLTSWNTGEEFASLGIGHFIWYPAGRRGPFEESFPSLIRFLSAHGRKDIQPWMLASCPWNTRAEFMSDLHGERLTALRNLLADTIPLQTRFLVARMRDSLPKMLDAVPPADAPKIRQNFARLESSARGVFALIDYVNFKGEGTLSTERYKGEGWGLLQVLQNMSDSGDPVRAFSKSASETLARRVRNSPPERHEQKWLPGWQARVARYTN